MAKDYSDEITVLLNQETGFDKSSQAQLAKIIYLDLKRIAIARLAMESADNTVTVTVLVHEAFMRLQELETITWRNRKHYFAAAAEAMRRVLIDRARYHLRHKRKDSKKSIPLEEGLMLESVEPEELIELNVALTDLESHDNELADLVKLRYFAGLSLKEIADLYEISPRTVDRRWQSARAWLLTEVERV